MQPLTKTCRFIGVHALQAKIGEELKESSTNYTLWVLLSIRLLLRTPTERRAYEVPQSTVSEQGHSDLCIFLDSYRYDNCVPETSMLQKR